MENKNQKIGLIIILSTVLFLAIIFIGMTYAFFTANNPEGSTAQIISKSGRMLINYNDGTDNIIPVTNIQPSNENILIDKTFTLTGINTTTGNTKMMPFDISIEYQNTFEYHNDLLSELMYFIKRVDVNDKVVLNIVDFLAAPTDELKQGLFQQYNFPTSLMDYKLGTFTDYSGKTYSQLIASGYFKPSDKNESVTLNLKMLFRETGEEQDYNKGATFNGKIVVTPGVEVEKIEDNWDVIATNVKNGNSSKYNVGAEKEVLIDGKEYRVRVANNSTPSECGNSEFSQTACGLVFEFVDVIENRVMNTESTNSGSWPASEMRTYVNGDLYNKLPEELKKNIIDTKVVTGHGRNDTSNFTSTDKLYLLSGHEVYEDDVNDKISEYDTAYNQTRQLDFYKSKNVLSNSPWNSDTIILQKDVLKYNNGASALWWLRAPYSYYSRYFLSVISGSFWDYGYSYSPLWLAPAFRIG